MQNQFNFFLYNELAQSGTTLALKKIVAPNENPPVIICIGSDLSVGDSLGPITGTKLKEKLKGTNCYIYGTLSQPITAHEIKFVNDFVADFKVRFRINFNNFGNDFVRNTHPSSPVIAIDAAVGGAGDIGMMRVAKRGVAPGSGANKKLAKVGDVSIIGIIAEKSVFNFSILSATRLNMVYKMANIIAEGVASFVTDYLQNAATGKASGDFRPTA